jgi:SH3 domain-containing protein
MRALALLLLLPLLCRAEPAVVIRATELKKEPATDASTVAELAENAAVDAGERKGGWTRAKTPGGSEGWVKMLLLRYGGPGTAKAGDSGLSQMFNVARTGTSGTTVTTGVRGLDAEQISNAQPNPAELGKMAGFAATKEASSGFAKRAKLQARHVDYPAP